MTGFGEQRGRSQATQARANDDDGTPLTAHSANQPKKRAKVSCAPAMEPTTYGNATENLYTRRAFAGEASRLISQTSQAA